MQKLMKTTATDQKNSTKDESEKCVRGKFEVKPVYIILSNCTNSDSSCKWAKYDLMQESE